MVDMEQVLQAFSDRAVRDFPELSEVLEQARKGLVTEETALRAMAEILMGNPILAAKFQAVALEALTPLQEDAAQSLDHDGLVLHKSRGLPQLNPLVEAAIIERLQFDDDIPEMRTGSMTSGATPAVPVETTVRNPVALGRMLTEASAQMAGKLAEQEPHSREILQRVALGDTTALAHISQTRDALSETEARERLLEGTTGMLDLPEYRRGALPTPVHVAPPSGALLLAMTPQERRQGAWQFLSTTHGRRTAVAGITELIDVKLQGEGFNVLVRPFEPGATEPVLAAHEWTVGIDGPGATQPAFSLIDIAAASITKGLAAKMDDRRGRVILEVTAVNTVDIRAVGWAARLLAQDGALSERAS